MNKFTLILFVSIVILGLVGGLWVLFPSQREALWNMRTTLGISRCLAPDEKAVFEVVEEGRPGVLRVSVINTIASTTVWSRDVEVFSTTMHYARAIGKCYFYVHQYRNYDHRQSDALPDFLWEIRRFPYFASGIGEQISVISENKSGLRGDRKNYYSSTFTVDPKEIYITLIRSQLGTPDYALVIRNLETGEDAFVLPMNLIRFKQPTISGSFSPGSWKENEGKRYFVNTIFDGSRINALIYIAEDTWDYEVLETPADYLPGVERDLAPFHPFFLFTNVIVWAGFAHVTEALIEEQIAEGKQKQLTAMNLRTGERRVIETVPTLAEHRFDPMWTSQFAFTYTLPDGTIKEYSFADWALWPQGE